MAGVLLVDMSLPVSDGAVIAAISAKRDGKNLATEKTSVSSGHRFFSPFTARTSSTNSWKRRRVMSVSPMERLNGSFFSGFRPM